MAFKLLSASTPTDDNIIAALDTHFSPSEIGSSPRHTIPQKRHRHSIGLSENPSLHTSTIDGHRFVLMKAEEYDPHSPILLPKDISPHEVAHTLFIQEENRHVSRYMCAKRYCLEFAKTIMGHGQIDNTKP